MKALALALLVLALVPAGASASPRQFSILQDDAVLLGLTDRSVEDAMVEAKALGVDTVRAFVIWDRVSANGDAKTKPPGFVVGDPNSPGYDWSRYDKFVEQARLNGLKVFLTLSPPLPDWASEQPNVCPHFVAGNRNLGKSCYWKPKPKVFGQFVKAAALRYRGEVSLWSMWNEPNLEHYLYPQRRGPGSGKGKVDLAAKRYRSLWYQGWKAIARHDPARRNKVLFGETAAISSPLDTIRAALCLDKNGNPFRGRLRALQGCKDPRKLPIGGFAVHPYNNAASGSVFTRATSPGGLPMSALFRLHGVADRAMELGRIPRSGRGVYVTEFGFQTNPPDAKRGLAPNAHARAINQSDRLFALDNRVKSVAQFELYDVPELPNEDVYNTGLRYNGGELKPAWRAYRLPLVVTKLSPNAVEVWGQVRPATGRVRPTIVAARSGRRSFSRIKGVRTNSAGYFRVVVRRRGASRFRWQLRWTDGFGEQLRSRVAKAGRKIRYLR